MEHKNPIQVADRIFQVIETLAAAGQTSLTDLSKELSLNKTTVHRILNSLIYMGYVKQDPVTSKYSLSFKIWEIANQLLTKIDIIELARPYLKQLVEKTGETVHMVQIDGIHAVYIDKVESYHNSVRLISRVGKKLPLYCSGVGKSLLAELPDNKIRDIWEQSNIKPLTEHTITEFPQFMNKINEVRLNGYALDLEENENGVRCIAASLKDYKGKAKYAFSISAPVSRMSERRLAELSQFILETKHSLQKEWYTES